MTRGEQRGVLETFCRDLDCERHRLAGTVRSRSVGRSMWMLALDEQGVAVELTLGVAGRAVIRDGGKILMLRRAADVFDGGLWELPGGKLEAGEELVAALVREISEETGLTVAVGRPFTTWHFAKEPFWVTGVTFLCDRVSGEVVLGREHSEYEWIVPAGYAGRPLATAVEEQLRAYVELLTAGGA